MANVNQTAGTTDANEVEAARELLLKRVERDGIESLEGMNTVMISATLDPRMDVDDPNALFEPSIEVAPKVNPVFDALLIKLGFRRTSETGYRIGAGEDADERVLRGLLTALDLAIVGSDNARRFHRTAEWRTSTADVWNILGETIAGSRLSNSDVIAALHQGVSRKVQDSRKYIGGSAVVLTSNAKEVYVRVITGGKRHGRKSLLQLYPDAPSLNLLKPVGKPGKPLRLAVPDALALLAAARHEGYEIEASSGLRELRKRMQDKAVVMRAPGAPGNARLLIPGSDEQGRKRIEQLGSRPLQPLLWGAKTSESDYSAITVGVKQVYELANELSCDVLYDPRVEDVVKMSVAEPVSYPLAIDSQLRPFQAEAVAIHNATNIGYVNICTPGTGKTVMSLASMREYAKRTPGARMLVVVPAALRDQWLRESARYFPEAEAGALLGSDLDDGLTELSARAADAPMLAIISYDTLRAGVERLLGERWDQIICDEATILGNRASKTSAALWRLREQAKIAVPMTGTPYDKSLDAVGNMISWARNEPDAFRDRKLSDSYDMTLSDHVEKFWEAMGPVLFRRDRSEIADQLPSIETDVITLTPTQAELRLADGARNGLKKIYERLCEKVEIAAALDPNDPKLRQARQDVKKIRGAVLAGITTARQAASDPEALKGSKSSGVALLNAAKLIEPAVKGGGTKSQVIVDMVGDAVAQGDAILIFTEFSTVARTLRDKLRARGARVGTFTGADSNKQRNKDAADFQAGDLDVLILTGAGSEGLNLQRATMLIHYDLPWVPSRVIQRVGRASRFGSNSDHLQVLIPIMAGTIEERVAAVLVPRTIKAISALDLPRGVDAKETDAGIAIGDLADAVSEDERGGEQSAFELAEQLLG